MPVRPYFFDYDWPQWARPFETNFGRTLGPDDLFTESKSLFPRYGYWYPKDERSSIKVGKNSWQISVDVQHFSPDEITVRTNNGFIVVEGKHEEKQDQHGFVSRHFMRRFKIPEDTNSDAIESRLSSDGVLMVLASRQESPKGERIVPISHTGPVRKENKEESLNNRY